jgi:hypothetical protein
MPMITTCIVYISYTSSGSLFQPFPIPLYFKDAIMRKRPYILYVFPVIVLLLLACREIYYPEGLNTGKAIPIIQGQITEDGSSTVVITRAMDYASSRPEYISHAEVIVSDNKGHEVTLTESMPGHYVDAVNELNGSVGTSYKLQVKLDDGEEYESSMVTLPEKPFVDSIYAVPGTLLAHEYDQNSRPFTVTWQGLYLSTSLSINTDSTQFYRFNTISLKESTCIQDPGTPNAIPMFIWEPTTLDFIYSVDQTVKSGSVQVRPAHPLGFVRHFYDPTMASPHYSAPIIIGWVISLKVYSISSDVYSYYQSVGAQLNSNDQMFAPVPSQVKSNIHCISNPELPVVGVFEATSSRTYYKAFQWVSMDTYKYVNLDSFPDDIKAGTKLFFPPSFWIDFN